MERIKEKLKMGQNKSKRAAKGQENVENTNTPSKHNLENAGSNSPPRSMKDILNSESRTKQFRTFLSSIDEENENNVEVLRLDFVLSCRKMQHIFSDTSSNPLSPSAAHGNAGSISRLGGGSSSASSTITESSLAMDVIAIRVNIVCNISN